MRHQPPPSLTTLEIASVFRICNRAVFVVKCISHDGIEELQNKIELVHAKFCKLDLTALHDAPVDVFKHDVQAIYFGTRPAAYRGEQLSCAIDPMLALDTEPDEPADLLARADNHPFISHGAHVTWECRAAEGCVQVLLQTPELGHNVRNMEDYETRNTMVSTMTDVIREAFNQKDRT